MKRQTNFLVPNHLSRTDVSSLSLLHKYLGELENIKTQMTKQNTQTRHLFGAQNTQTQHLSGAQNIKNQLLFGA